MVLDISALNNDDAFNESAAPYPPHPPVSSFPIISNFSEEEKNRFIAVQLGLAQREFGFRPTPTEREGLEYYHAQFYAAESKGALYGTLGGLAIGGLFCARQKRVGFPVKQVGGWLRLSNRTKLMASRAANVAFVGALGRLYGMTTHGVTAFNKIAKEQKEDPHMQRYIQMRNAYLAQRKENARRGIPQQSVLSGVEELARTGERIQRGEQDAPEEPPAPAWEDRPISEQVAEVLKEEPRAPRRGRRAQHRHDEPPQEPEPDQAEDTLDGLMGPPVGDVRKEEPPAAWRSSQSKPQGGSSWEQIRRGDGNAPQAGAWPRRAAMKGYEAGGAAAAAEPREDGREEDREDAQRRFDEQVQREREGHSADGFVGDGARRR